MQSYRDGFLEVACDASIGVCWLVLCLYRIVGMMQQVQVVLDCWLRAAEVA
jgi:hypothetical protein